MSLVDDLLVWPAELKDWQRDALRRLFIQDALSPADLDSQVEQLVHGFRIAVY